MNFLIRLADRIIAVHSLYDGVGAFCSRYLCTDCAAEPEITIAITEEDIRREEAAVNREALRTGIPMAYAPEELETSALCRRIAAELAAFDTFLMHGAVVATAGQGYMFTAPSGI